MSESFWKKVQIRGPNDCWLWKAGFFKSGYGQHKAGIYAHRYAWELANNACIIPGRNNVVRHVCDVPACCNPAHLILGSQKENILDAWEKERGTLKEAWRRQFRGERRPNARLNDDCVREIRAAIAAGEPQRKLAARLGISRGLISDIVYGKSWTHVK